MRRVQEQVLDLLQRYLVEEWVVEELSPHTYLLRTTSPEVTNHIISEVLILERPPVVSFLRRLHHSVTTLLRFAEPRDLRRLSKELPEISEDLPERVSRYLALDVHWRRATQLPVIGDLAQALLHFSEILSTVALERGFQYMNLTYLSDLPELLEKPRELKLWKLAFTAVVSREGHIYLGTLVQRPSTRLLEVALRILLEVVLRCAETDLRWLLTGSIRVGRCELEKKLRTRYLT